MARQRQEMLPNHQRELPPDEPAAAPGRGRRDDGTIRLAVLDAGRVLMLLGWGTLTAAVSTTRGNRPPDGGDDAANSTRAFVGLLMWLVGVSLVTVVTPPALRGGRFPRVAPRGAAVCDLVMGCFFRLWN